MRLNIKIVVAATAWTIAIGAAIAGSITGNHEFAVWAILSAGLAAFASSALALDYVAHETAKWVVEQMHAERDAAVKAIVEALSKCGQGKADQIVERMATKQDKSVERFTGELADALASRTPPTPLHR